MPKSAFINVFDFDNFDELSKYLIYLDQNKTAYNSYFKWKKYVQFKDDILMNNFCDMCLMLNLESEMPIRRNIIRNIGEFWGNQNCQKLNFNENNEYFLS